ncbi:MAG TPA: hypothetical protein VIH86_00460 [Puia sp.]
MKPITTLLIIASAYFLSSCGQSSEQKAFAEKQRTDSIIAATADSVKKATEDSVQIANAMVEVWEKKTLIKNAIPYIDSKLQIATTAKTNADMQMANIESFHFLRTAEEKQSQMSNEQQVEQNLNNQVGQLQTIEKIFRLTNDNMDWIETKKFKSFSDFKAYTDSIGKQVQKMQRQIIDESDFSQSIGNFDIFTMLRNQKFVAEVNEFKATH